MASPWFAQLAVFDLETTGIDVETSRIVSAHVGVLDSSGAAIESYDWLADPGIEIPAGATAVHGITTQRAREEGRPARQVVAEIILCLETMFARGLAVAIYNAPYDLTLLHREAIRHKVAPLVEPNPVIDPLVMDKSIDRYRAGKRTLTAAAEFYGVNLSDAHNAGADAIAAGRVAQAMARLYDEELGIAALELHAAQIGWCEEQQASFIDYMRRTHNPNYVSTRSGAWPHY
jgi:DNA polymerase-3 subunit epsilon